MPKQSPTQIEPPSLLSDDEASNCLHRRISKPTELPLFQPSGEPTACASPSTLDASRITSSSQQTLLERREKKHCNARLPILNAETLRDDSRENISRNSNSESSTFRGWSKTDIGQKINSPSLNGAVKIVSYNILAQRFVTSELYVHCPMFALAEDYRCSRVIQELRHTSADIIALQEVSVDVFEKDDLLGGRLRSEYGYAGHHVVITDRGGRPKCCSEGHPENSTSIYSSGDVMMTSSELKRHDTSEIVHTTTTEASERPQRRSEMEGVSIFFLKQRFDLCEAVPIRFNEIAAADVRLTPRERHALQVGSHNVALISVLRDRLMPNMIYVIGTVHLIWQHTECQLWQMQHVLSELERLVHKYEGNTNEIDRGCKPIRVSAVLTGDFNADPNAPPIHYALKGNPPPGSKVMGCWRVPEGEGEAAGNVNSNTNSNSNSNSTTTITITTDNNNNNNNNTSNSSLAFPDVSPRKRYRITQAIAHSLPLTDAYACYRDQYPCHVSAVNHSSNSEGRVLDHVLLDERHVVCAAVLRLTDYAKLPNLECPSDHYPVGVILIPRSLLT